MHTSFPNSDVVTKSSTWKLLTIIALAFWLSGSVLLGTVVMPSLYVTGMMTQPDFASAGYTLFGIFNRVELVCAALALTGVFVLRSHHDLWHRRGYAGVILASVLLLITLVDTYTLTPQMSAMGLQ
ncbi:MAG: DUF4149 domain-containing protein, partial [Leptolyngbyaceae cyanobacterium bins.59]|nr:DUF4149 domain-containing protein [Leptolyngbyaceae cyanobacterium bins.59]